MNNELQHSGCWKHGALTFFCMISFACNTLWGRKGRDGREERRGEKGRRGGGEGRGGEKENQTSLVSDASSHVLGVNVLFTKVLWVQEFGGMRG